MQAGYVRRFDVGHAKCCGLMNLYRIFISNFGAVTTAITLGAGCGLTAESSKDESP